MDGNGRGRGACQKKTTFVSCFVKLNYSIPFRFVPSYEMDSSEILKITWNEHFILWNNENRSESIPRIFIRNGILMATLCAMCLNMLPPGLVWWVLGLLSPGYTLMTRDVHQSFQHRTFPLRVSGSACLSCLRSPPPPTSSWLSPALPGSTVLHRKMSFRAISRQLKVVQKSAENYIYIYIYIKWNWHVDFLPLLLLSF
jgi:hypothetical protein